jgi:hypothetical protein
MRPIYETDFDRDREFETINSVSMEWGVSFCRTPVRYPCDAVLLKDGHVIGWAEVKNRDCYRDTYPTYLISVSKVIDLLNYEEKTGFPAVIIVGWNDIIGHIEVKRIPYCKIGMGGRMDRGDWQDQEPCFMVPIHMFKFIPYANCS